MTTKVLRFRIAGALLTIAAMEGVAQIGFLWIRQRDGLIMEPAYSGVLSDEQKEIVRTRILDSQTDYTDYSVELGWSIKPHGRSALYNSNSRGIRSDREYEPRPGASTVRIAAFGDSYTHGDDVANKDTWAAQLEGRSAHLEVLNFGVGGYGTDQALLRYQLEGVAFAPRIVLLGFRPENINRGVSVFRPFYTPKTGLLMTKPRFALRGTELVLIPNPLASRESYRALLTDPASELARLGQHDYHYRRSYHYAQADALAIVRMLRLATHRTSLALNQADRIEVAGQFNDQSEAFKILTATMSRFRDLATSSGARPIVVILPDDDDINDFRSRGTKRYAPLIAFLEDHGVEHLDTMDAFQAHATETPVAELFSGHYNARGNSIVSRYVHDYLVAQHVLPDSTASTAAPQ